MPKIITIDAATVAQVRITTDATGAIQVYCDYTLTAAGAPIQSASDNVTSILGSGTQTSALSAFNDVLQALGSALGVTAIGPGTAANLPPPTSQPTATPTGTPVATATPAAPARRPASGR